MAMPPNTRFPEALRAAFGKYFKRPPARLITANARLFEAGKEQRIRREREFWKEINELIERDKEVDRCEALKVFKK